MCAREPTRKCVQFQSTPPRREVTDAHGSAPAMGVISIHTSPKGGDLFQMPVSLRQLISIHTSPKGGDKRPLLTQKPPHNFNPHLPEGR